MLLANALQIGAYIAGADEQAQEALYQFGIAVGLAFQIQDDILDVWGDPKTFGKVVGGDISCNKKTFVYLTALHRATQSSTTLHRVTQLQQWYSQLLQDNTEKIVAVKTIFEQLEVREACEMMVADYTQKALQILATLPQNAATAQLRQLANKLNTRQD